MTTQTLEDKLGAGRFVVTAEITPPLAASADLLFERAAPLKGVVDAVNVTDAPGARATMSSFAASALLQQAGIEPVLQITCRDRNRIALAADLLGAAAFGVRNLLILHGDDPKTGDQPDAAPVYDLDSRQVMALARHMRDEKELPSGRAIEAPPHFHIGAADTPFDPPDDFEPKGLNAKIEAGAQFAQTQFCFDIEVAKRYFARLAQAGVTERLKFIVGVGPVASARSARWMNDNLFGVSVPDQMIARLEGADDERAEGKRICVELIEAYREVPGICGVHIMAPQQKVDVIAEIVEMAGLD